MLTYVQRLEVENCVLRHMIDQIEKPSGKQERSHEQTQKRNERGSRYAWT